ncbi:RNA 2',3'-cyclic phosphodiesterase [Paenibacillus humicola]|uniref:RNA 2',3'-cyclic phosphodiesterase n=1 Tax=Paenibacillus humicola TaxID=3110540 RepID=UPI00237B7043|nr:RNA 2',3'-cyclic phosphodiesterase [Paenibacillus humicola]
MSDSDDLRLFAAVPLPDELKRAVADWCGPIAKELPFRKWTVPADLHITLQFLGSTPPGRIPGIRRALQSAADRVPLFELTVGPPGLFGRPGNPSVLWAGVGGAADALGRLQELVSEALAPLGYQPDERAYRPHLTLARTYSGKEPLEKTKLAGFGIPGGGGLRWTVSEIALYISRLGRRPPQPMYEADAFFPLAGGRGETP